MPRKSQFKQPGHHMLGFAADGEIDSIVANNLARFGDKSKTIRALIKLGDANGSKDIVAELLSEINDLRGQLAESLKDKKPLPKTQRFKPEESRWAGDPRFDALAAKWAQQRKDWEEQHGHT